MYIKIQPSRMIRGPINRQHSNLLILTYLAILGSYISSVESFTFLPHSPIQSNQRSTFLQMSSCQDEGSDGKKIKGIDMSSHPSILPGDPSLTLTTNLDLGDKKLEIMKGVCEFI